MSTSYQIADNLYLVCRSLHQKSASSPTPVEVPTNHFAVIDCSGSMYYDLPKIRTQLKKRLPLLLKEKDTITVIWFSGRNQCGTLIEAEPVATLGNLQDVEKAIDRWLKPMGLTGFKEPLDEAAKVVERVNKARLGSASALFFMSDGCDNQWPKRDILDAVKRASVGFATATFVEYGYYADRPLLTAMAENAGGSLIFAEDFNTYAPVFENAVQKLLSNVDRIAIDLDGDTIEGFAFGLYQGDLVSYSVEAGCTHVPEDLEHLWYLAPEAVGTTTSLATLAENRSDSAPVQAAYAAVSLFANRMKPKVVLPLLKALGDIRFIEQFSSCFGKQAYSAFCTNVNEAVNNCNQRWTQGWDPNRVPADDAFTVLDLMQLLAEDEGNRILLDDPDFSYSRIGRGRIDASDQLTAEEQQELQELTTKLGTLKSASAIKNVNARIAEITDNKAEALKFQADPAPEGYPVSSLTFTENRPNVSFMVRKTGTVDLTSRLEGAPETIPSVLSTFIFRNYAVIKDGLVNIDKLPVRVTLATYHKIRSKLEGVEIREVGSDHAILMMNLRAIPVINQKMVKDVSAKSFFEAKYSLLKAQAAQKVYNTYSKELLPAKTSANFASQYGEDGAKWLKDQGITDYSGFSPKTVQAEATDVYLGKELKVSLKGLSSLPSVKDVHNQRYKKKLSPSGALMSPYVELVEGFLSSEAYKQAAEKERVLEAWLGGQAANAKKEVRRHMFDLAQTAFALVVGQTWFSEFSSLEENSLDLHTDNGTVSCKVEMREIEIKI